MFAASSTDDTPTGRKQHQVTEVAVTGKNGGGNLQTTEIHKVIVVGMTNVGKTALLQQFMTSHYMAAVCTSFGMHTFELLIGCDFVTFFFDNGVQKLRVPMIIVCNCY